MYLYRYLYGVLFHPATPLFIAPKQIGSVITEPKCVSHSVTNRLARGLPVVSIEQARSDTRHDDYRRQMPKRDLPSNANGNLPDGMHVSGVS